MQEKRQKHDPVNSPRHYTSHPSGIECIQVTRYMNFNRGNAIKYIWRAGEKGAEIEDLKKAIWYLQDEIERLRGTQQSSTPAEPTAKQIAAARKSLDDAYDKAVQEARERYPLKAIPTPTESNNLKA
jgi:hypothetical protein